MPGPPDMPEYEHLDFTYLFDDVLDNFDFDRMGEGEMISASGAFGDDERDDSPFVVCRAWGENRSSVPPGPSSYR
jgi:hypothetical protein